MFAALASAAPLHRETASEYRRLSEKRVWRRPVRRQETLMSLFSLDGKVAVITGSSRGIGRAIAERMAEHGARVVISSRKAEPCQQVADAINAKYGAGRAISVPANISRKEELKNLVDATHKQWGRIDVLVCNAASNPYYGPQAGIEDEQF